MTIPQLSCQPLIVHEYTNANICSTRWLITVHH